MNFFFGVFVLALVVFGFFYFGEVEDHSVNVFAEASDGISDPTPRNIEIQSAIIKNGAHAAGLMSIAAIYCPHGYRILEEGVPKANAYAFQPKIQYRVNQSFAIICTAGGTRFWN